MINKSYADQNTLKILSEVDVDLHVHVHVASYRCKQGVQDNRYCYWHNEFGK